LDNINKPQSIKRYRYFQTVKIMMNDKELMEKIEGATRAYQGDIGYLYEAVGMVVIGRLFGWRVMRLVSSNRCWIHAKTLLGDPKGLMPERGPCYDKSVGMRFIDKTGDYWDYIKRHKSIPIAERKLIQ
jgi:hypothetical protein